ncbi:MAG: hypothetical protein LUQ69_09605 [Methanoregulaceae archaeon]|nr:hypothetical protein [Methanoregulaceae archaeon]
MDYDPKQNRRKRDGLEREKWTMYDTRDPQSETRPMHTRDFFSRHYKQLFLIPFICILLAILIMGISKYPNPPDSDDYEDPDDDYRKDLQRFNNIIEDVQNTADILFTIGILALSFLFFIAPFLDLNFNIALKIAMLVIGVVLVTHFLNGGFNLQVIFG